VLREQIRSLNCLKILAPAPAISRLAENSPLAALLEFSADLSRFNQRSRAIFRGCRLVFSRSHIANRSWCNRAAVLAAFLSKTRWMRGGGFCHHMISAIFDEL